MGKSASCTAHPNGVGFALSKSFIKDIKLVKVSSNLLMDIVVSLCRKIFCKFLFVGKAIVSAAN